ncbi:MAG TPA: LysR family transcriptional regulator [Candidatus Egerieimonas intestinavium]|uniref:LysR family transcriptional regulator n=1 Tax=Candidatus Egerieimonas intestinavium TaxID=2840777 RepID=A0A9D1EIG7_9FIRM|nr:LysR family transcriptional regulator [Candidatus Egerieimonas intestinavium]
MSFSKAAAHLGYTQSTITHQINSLEEELGVRLFDRHGKQFQLNQKGQELLQYANQLVSLEKEAKSMISDANTPPKGFLRIGVIESLGSYFLPDILSCYLESFPLVQIKVYTATTLEIMEMLRLNQIDLMLTLDNRVADEDWLCAWEKKEEIIFLCSKDHPFARRSNVSIKELSRENFLLTEKGCNYRQVFEQICNENRINLRFSLEIGSTNTILDFTQKGLGITFLPELTAKKELQAGKLSAFQAEGISIHMLIQLIYRKSKWCSPAMKAFISLVKDL